MFYPWKTYFCDGVITQSRAVIYISESLRKSRRSVYYHFIKTRSFLFAMIYLDNSATTSFKPKCVKNAVISAIDNLSANAGRSGHRKSVCAATLVYRTRRKLADFAGCDGDVVFTENCTEALNLAILGSIARGSHVITTVYEHNSVLRPLFESENAGKISVLSTLHKSSRFCVPTRGSLPSITYPTLRARLPTFTESAKPWKTRTYACLWTVRRAWDIFPSI